MKIAILGTRGIPNYHGGFEQFAEFFSVYMNKKGHEVYVYNSHSHPYQKVQYKGVHLLHKYDPEGKIGTAGQFIYDLNCILDSRQQNFDVILQLGYTSSSIWGWLLPKKSLVITNMDGLEWKRSKYSKGVRIFLKYAEKLAVNTSDYLISDSLGIQSYIKQKFNKESEYIAYGADLFSSESPAVLSEYSVNKYNYNLLIARLEPENNIEMILDGVSLSNKKRTFLVIGKHDTKFGNYLKDKYKDSENIRFLGGIYNLDHLNNLRFWSNLYFHGHSVGGTNPSLLEAMASNCLIIANDNIFNKSILGNDAFYFNSVDDVIERLTVLKENNLKLIENNRLKIKNEFEWGLINGLYHTFILKKLENS
jgi:glycosyltransferase involved in cell wall biosynthesis